MLLPGGIVLVERHSGPAITWLAACFDFSGLMAAADTCRGIGDCPHHSCIDSSVYHVLVADRVVSTLGFLWALLAAVPLLLLGCLMAICGALPACLVAWLVSGPLGVGRSASDGQGNTQIRVVFWGLANVLPALTVKTSSVGLIVLLRLEAVFLAQLGCHWGLG